MPHSLNPTSVLLAAAAALSLSACVVGPNYKGAPVVAPQAMGASAFHRAGEAVATAPDSKWWTALNDAELNHLVEAALTASPDLEAARARLRQSRAGLKNQKAKALPNTGIAGVGLFSDGLTSALTGGPPQALNFYNVGFDATWEVDLFGGQRRAVEGAKAQAAATQADLEGAKVSLEAEVADAYATLRGLQQSLLLSRESAAIETRELRMTEQRRAGGAATDLDVERLNTQLQSTQAGLVPLQAQIAEQLDRLAVLTGREPGALDAELTSVAPVPAPPAVVAVGDPASLLRRRPDIRAAERRLAQRNALIGQRTADLFPKVTLLGDIGSGASDITRVFGPNSLNAVGAPILQWSPLDFGRVRSTISQAKAGRDEALANYRKTVLGALQDAETSLSRYGRQREAVISLARVKASADHAAALTDLRVKGGTASTIDALDAERQRADATDRLQQAVTDLTRDYVALQKSLGLGWDVSAPAVTTTP
jgi:NodT family efflux transporter outer membrane factor (OMF) lipoprotein